MRVAHVQHRACLLLLAAFAVTLVSTRGIEDGLRDDGTCVDAEGDSTTCAAAAAPAIGTQMQQAGAHAEAPSRWLTMEEAYAVAVATSKGGEKHGGEAAGRRVVLVLLTMQHCPACDEFELVFDAVARCVGGGELDDCKPDAGIATTFAKVDAAAPSTLAHIPSIAMVRAAPAVIVFVGEGGNVAMYSFAAAGLTFEALFRRVHIRMRPPKRSASLLGELSDLVNRDDSPILTDSIDYSMLVEAERNRIVEERLQRGWQTGEGIGVAPLTFHADEPEGAALFFATAFVAVQVALWGYGAVRWLKAPTEGGTAEAAGDARDSDGDGAQ